MNTVFDPRTIGDKRMTVAYPELKRIREFDNLSDAEIKFAWYFGCPSSPFFGEMDKTKRCKLSVKESGMKLTGAEIDRYELLDFTEKMRNAIDRMSRVDINTRERARDIVNSILNNYELFSKTWNSENAEAYISASAKIIRELPNILKMKEEGFSVADNDKRRNASGGQDNVSDFLTQKRENNG